MRVRGDTRTEERTWLIKGLIFNKKKKALLCTSSCVILVSLSYTGQHLLHYKCIKIFCILHFLFFLHFLYETYYIDMIPVAWNGCHRLLASKTSFNLLS